MTGTAAASARVRLIDVRTLPADERRTLLRSFEREVYAPAFPDADVRENPQVWLDLMERDPGPPAPLVAPQLALDDDGVVLGGAVVEYYRRSGTALLTYLVVAPTARGQGLGRRLGEAAVARAGDLAVAAGGAAPIVFAEAERPELAGGQEERAAAEDRLKTLAALGAARADLDYRQPPLAPGLKSKRLNLLAAATSLPEPNRAPAGRVKAFLAELYESLGCDPTTSSEFAAMAGALDASGFVSFRKLAGQDGGGR